MRRKQSFTSFSAHAFWYHFGHWSWLCESSLKELFIIFAPKSIQSLMRGTYRFNLSSIPVRDSMGIGVMKFTMSARRFYDRVVTLVKREFVSRCANLIKRDFVSQCSNWLAQIASKVWICIVIINAGIVLCKNVLIVLLRSLMIHCIFSSEILSVVIIF